MHADQGSKENNQKKRSFSNMQSSVLSVLYGPLLALY